MNGNLNELHVPPNADEAADFAARREFGLRYDSYREAKLWGMVEGEQWLPRVARNYYRCNDPEQAWIDMLSDSGHSVRADLLEPRVLFDTPGATMWSDGVLRIQEKP